MRYWNVAGVHWSQVVDLPLKSALLQPKIQELLAVLRSHAACSVGRAGLVPSAATSRNEKRDAQPRISESSLTVAGARQGLHWCIVEVVPVNLSGAHLYDKVYCEAQQEPSESSQRKGCADLQVLLCPLERIHQIRMFFQIFICFGLS